MDDRPGERPGRQRADGGDSEKQPIPDGGDSEEQPIPDGGDSEEQPIPDGGDSEKQPIPDGGDSEEQPIPDGGYSDERTTSNDRDGRRDERSSPVESRDAGGDTEQPDPLRTVAIALGAGALGFLALLVWTFLLAAVASPFAGTEFTGIQQQLVGTVALGLGMATGTAMYLRLSGRDRTFIDVDVPSVREVGYVVGGVIALFAAVVAISQAAQWLGVPPSEHGTVQAAREGNPELLLVLVPLSVLVIGPGEELLFRNVVQKVLYDAFSRRASIGIASVIFALVHFQAYSAGDPTIGQVLSSLGVVFALSTLLGWIYHRTENLLVPALVHGIYNAVLFGSLYLELTGVL